ncbi:MAG: ABC transporter permease [Actinomycetota bacterium]|nr:ABC transporter permease [Actinomycetota bacterium]
MLRDELGLMFGRLRIRVLLVVLAAVPIGYAIGVRLSGHATADAPPFVGQIPQNGVYGALAGLTATVPAVLPLILAVVAGDAIAGEADFGTLRSLLTAPVSRARLLATKLTAVCVFALVAAFVVTIAGLLAGALLFHLGPVPTVLGPDDPLPSAHLLGPALPLLTGVGQVLLAALIAGAQLFGFAAIGVFLSCLTRIPLGATVGIAGVLGLSDALEAAAFFKPLRPAIPSTYWDGYTALLHTGLGLDNLLKALAVSLCYLLVFGTAAWVKFRRADITS